MAVLRYKDNIDSGTPGSILSSFYRQLLRESGIQEGTFNTRLDRHVYNLVLKGEIPQSDINSKRGNLYNELLSDRMTWGVFMKGLHLLGVKQFTFHLLYDYQGQEYISKVSVDTNDDEQGERYALANLFADIKYRIGISPLELSRAVSAYLLKQTDLSSEDLAQKRGGINKELKANTMSWLVFVKALDIMRICSFTLLLENQYAVGPRTLHAKTILLGS